MREERIVLDYAIGGAMAVLFYAEPTRTYDVDVFILLRPDQEKSLAPLSSIYDWAQAQGFDMKSEHLMIHGVPVQLVPAYNDLVVEAVQNARLHDYEGVAVRVVDPDHLVALALQAGGARRRERAWQLLQSGTVARERLRAILTKHSISAQIPDDV